MKALLNDAGMSFEMYPKMLGKPDFLVGRRVALFCDSSFWHGRNWPKLKRQLERGSNPEYWVRHIENNRKRDREVSTLLRSLGYTVLRFWDEQVLRSPERCVDTILAAEAETSSQEAAKATSTRKGA